MTKDGRIAVLTNFREDGVVPLEGKSRGAIVNAFLAQPSDSLESTEHFVEKLVANEGLKGVGGFSLACGRIGKPLAVISNRTPSMDGITWIAEEDETIGLSNAAFANRSWPKVLQGEELLSSVINNAEYHGSEAAFIDDLFGILYNDSLPKRPNDEGWDSYVKELRKSIFIPPIGGEGANELSSQDLAAAKSERHVKVVDQTEDPHTGDGRTGLYGTQKQTVVIVRNDGKATFVERTLYDEYGRAIPEASILAQQRRFDFFIDGWKEE